MKALFVSLAFFLCADADQVTTRTTTNSAKENSLLTLEELMDFRKASPQSISKSLTKKNWVNTTEKDIKEDNIDKDESSWELGTQAALYYTPATTEKSKYEGPYITYVFNSEGSYVNLIKQADKTKNLKWCRDPEHEVYKEDTEYHYTSNDYNIIFTQADIMGILSSTVRIYGKRK